MKERGITLIALVITIIVLLILAGVSISLVVGNNGVLGQATNAVNKNREAQATEEIEMAWASCETDYWSSWASNSSVTKADFFRNKIGDYLSGVGEVSSFTYNEGGISEITYKSNSSADSNPKQYTISVEGKVEKKEGLILDKIVLALEPTETATISAELVGLDGTITWTSDTPGVATVSDGVVTAIANGTANITATCGTNSATCKVTVASELVNIDGLEGKYVNLNIGYVDQMNSTDYTTATNIKKAWRVLSKNTTTGVVNLISTGHPLNFYHQANPTNSKIEMDKISTQIITVNPSTTCGYRANGFSTNDVKSLFNNTAVFTEMQPARYSVEGVSVTGNTPDDIRITGRTYWLGEPSPWDSRTLWSIENSGVVNAHGYDTFGVRLVISLVSNINISGGSGTEADPYTLSGITY